jgi:uncharacterized protein YndB with AHSA1/START domain/mannose-6-phosphate isomerase-like protein (cupin superfamily)
MTTRIDSASRLIPAPPERVYRAFATPGAMERWIPPRNMTGRMLHFDFRQGGSYRIRLTYDGPDQGSGKTAPDYDEVEARLTRIEPGASIEQEITFDSQDAAFSGVMRMTWIFQPEREATLVTVRAENVPAGISREEHEAGMNSSLENLEAFLEESRPGSIPSADAYAREPVRYPPLVVVNLAAEADAVTEEYRNQVLCQVNDSCLRLAVLTGDYPWHRHPRSDELFVVLEGRLEIELADNSTLTLAPLQSVVIPAGTVHRTRGVGRTVNLCFETIAAETAFVE